MNESDRRFWLKQHQRASNLQPEIERAVLRALQIIRDSLSDQELADIIRAGNFDVLFSEVLNDTLIDRATSDLRLRIRRVADRSFQYATADMPKGGKIDGVLAIRFDYLSPHVITAIRQLDSATLQTLRNDIRETVRAFVEQNIRDGMAPSKVARQIRDMIGLSPNQAGYVRNLRDELTSGKFTDAQARKLLDRRFNLDNLAKLSEAERAKRIDLIVDAYRKRLIAMNAETVATTATRDAYKLGQKLAWQDAVEKGVVGSGQLMRKWIHFDPQPDPRPSHIAMAALPPVPADQPYTNGDTYAGESDPWNCFVPGTLVEGSFVAGLKASYSGPIREIETARGYRLRVTPNHPVLTDKGWVAANLISEGDTLFSRVDDGCCAVGDVDDQDRPSSVDDVFQSLGTSGPLPPGVALDLHGDAIWCDSDVDVVRADRDLRFESPVKCYDRFDDGALASSDLLGSLECGAGHRNSARQGNALTAPCEPRHTADTLDLPAICTDVLPAQSCACGPAANWNTTLGELSKEQASAVSGFIRELLQASSGEIAHDQVVNVRDVAPGSVCHVFDFQALDGWMVAQNIIVSNCKCLDKFFIA